MTVIPGFTTSSKTLGAKSGSDFGELDPNGLLPLPCSVIALLISLLYFNNSVILVDSNGKVESSLEELKLMAS